MTVTIDPGAIEYACRRLEQSRFAHALRTRRLERWSADHAVQQQIAGRLGWIDVIATVSPHLPGLRAFAASIRDGGISASLRSVRIVG